MALDTSACSVNSACSVLSTDTEPLNTDYTSEESVMSLLSTDTEPLYESADNQASDHDSSFSPLVTSTPYRASRTRSLIPVPHCRRHRRSSSSRDPVAVLNSNCCKLNCIKSLSPLDVQTCEQKLYHLNESEEKQFVLQVITEHSHNHVSKSSNVFTHHNLVVRGKTVCEKCWCLAHNVTYRRFLSCVKMFKEGQTRVFHGNLGRKTKMEKTTMSLGWMRHLFERIGDWMPHRTEVCIPQTYTKKSLYHRMVEEFNDRRIGQQEIISYEHFTSMWSEHLSEFVISKRSDFTVCTICTSLKEKRQRASTEPEVRDINLMLKQHNQAVEKERQEYHTARERARRHPEDLTVIIIDGMDQSKTDVPHFTKRDKASCNLARLPVHLTGVLLHTSVPGGKIPLVFTDMKDVPHDSNMTLNCLLQVLSSHKEILGRVLFLQLDNCYRENKNRYVLAFAAVLIEMDVFEEVLIHFLPVGHTHEDVDQLFSCIASRLRKNDVYTMNDLVTQVTQSYSPSICVRPATPQYDIKQWLMPHLYGDFKNHSNPHWFKFQKVDGQCRMHYRFWATSPWEPQLEYGVDDAVKEDSKGLLCLKSIPNVQDVPAWVEPSLEKMDVPALKKDLPDSEGYTLRLPHSAREWWKIFLENISDLQQVPPISNSWQLQQLHGLSNAKTLPTESTSSELQIIRRKINRDYPQVSIGDQGKRKKGEVSVEESRRSVGVGDLVAIHLEEKSNRPFIAKVTEREGGNLTVHWMKGSYIRGWKLWMVGMGKTKKPYIDTFSVESVILWGFSLTEKGNLTKATCMELKRKYKELDQ